MKVYHEASPDSLGPILKHGLKRTPRGEKGDDKLIAQTDHYLDKYRPQNIKLQNISRNDAIYAYVSTADSIIDITDGTHIPIEYFVAHSTQAVIEIEIDPYNCYVSDLDIFDQLKQALGAGEPAPVCRQLASNYWHSVVPLQAFDPTMTRRPEIIIPTDISPEQMSTLST